MRCLTKADRRERLTMADLDLPLEFWTSELVFRLAQALRIDDSPAAGYAGALFAQLAIHRTRGRIDEISDELLERWAGWHDQPGAFAAAARELLVDDAGVVRGWHHMYGKLEDKQRRDRERVATRRARTRDAAQPTLGRELADPPFKPVAATSRDVAATSRFRSVPFRKEQEGAPCSAGVAARALEERAAPPGSPAAAEKRRDAAPMPGAELLARWRAENPAELTEIERDTELELTAIRGGRMYADAFESTVDQKILQRLAVRTG